MNNERGMKKWAPFSSLNEQESFLSKMLSERKKEHEQLLSDDQIEEIEYILNNCLSYKLKIYYYDNTLKSIEGYVDKIDNINNVLHCNNKLIKIPKIKKIELR